MFWRARWIGLIAIFSIGSGVLLLQPSVGQDAGSLDGTWEGKLEVVDSGAPKDSDSDQRIKAAYAKSPFKITIHGQRASVYFGETEVKPGLFRAEVYMTNAVVFASSDGSDQDGRWVETWNFSLTRKNPETLIAYFSRVVNNLDLAEAKDGSKFGLLAAGSFHLTSR
jgi:hypothetical protein